MRGKEGGEVKRYRILYFLGHTNNRSGRTRERPNQEEEERRERGW